MTGGDENSRSRIGLIDEGVCPTCRKEYSGRQGVVIHHRAHDSPAITAEMLLEELDRLHEELDRVPKQNDMTDHGIYGASVYEYRFGGWNAALREAGYPVNSEQNIPTDALLTEIKRLHDDLGHVPGQEDMDEYGEYSSMPYYTRFGSWNEAVNKAGYQINCRSNYDTIPKSELLAELDKLGDELGRVPRGKDMAAHGRYGESTYHRQFGSWNDALKEAGYELNVDRDIDNQALLHEINRLVDELGRIPTQTDMTAYGEYGMCTYQRRFGSWNDAVKEAGYGPTVVRDIPTEALLEELDRLYEELGRVPCAGDMRGRGAYSELPYCTRFGSWNGALKEAGYEPNVYRKISNKDLLNDLDRLYDDLGRIPRARDIDKYGKYSASVYERRFESWYEIREELGRGQLTHTDWVSCGEDHPNWNGGVFPYGPGWNESKKEQVRERDGRMCQNPRCNRTEKEHIEHFGKKHSVHHIQKARSFDDPERRNHPDNLITLCETKECHKAWEKMSPLRPQVVSDD